MSTATSAFTTVPSLTGPDLNSYLLGSLRPKCSSGEIHTDGTELKVVYSEIFNV